MDSSPRDDVILITDTDLDGTGVYYILRKYIGQDFTCIQTSERKFKERFLELKDKQKYKKIYICDLAVLNTCKDLIDLPNVVYINHRNCELEASDTVHLRNDSQDSPSCSMLIYKRLKDKFKVPLTTSEKHLILLINDYDSYILEYPETIKLNFLHTALTGDKCRAFYNLFESGFSGFSQEQSHLIDQTIQEFNNIFKDLKVFKGNLDLNNKTVCICSTFNNKYVSEICSKVISTYNCDIVINVNLKNNHLSLRKRRDLDLHLGKFAKKLFDGGGDAFVAGGQLNNNFLQISKQLLPIT